MRGKSVWIRVSCRQRDEVGEWVCLSYEARGDFGVRGDAMFLTYEEPEGSGLSGTRTTLFLSEREVKLVRTGAVVQRLSFAENQMCESAYRTDVGTIFLRAQTHRLEQEMAGCAGRLRILYTMEAEGLFRHENELLIEVGEDAGFHGH